MTGSDELMTWVRAEIGVSESHLGSNPSIIVDEYLRSVNSPPGKAWCVSFIYWCHQQAVITGLPQTTNVENLGCL